MCVSINPIITTIATSIISTICVNSGSRSCATTITVVMHSWYQYLVYYYRILLFALLLE